MGIGIGPGMWGSVRALGIRVELRFGLGLRLILKGLGLGLK